MMWWMGGGGGGGGRYYLFIEQLDPSDRRKSKTIQKLKIADMNSLIKSLSFNYIIHNFLFKKFNKVFDYPADDIKSFYRPSNVIIMMARCMDFETTLFIYRTYMTEYGFKFSKSYFQKIPFLIKFQRSKFWIGHATGINFQD